MSEDGLDPVIHAPARLRLMVTLSFGYVLGTSVLVDRRLSPLGSGHVDFIARKAGQPLCQAPTIIY